MDGRYHSFINEISKLSLRLFDKWWLPFPCFWLGFKAIKYIYGFLKPNRQLIWSFEYLIMKALEYLLTNGGRNPIRQPQKSTAKQNRRHPYIKHLMGRYVCQSTFPLYIGLPFFVSLMPPFIIMFVDHINGQVIFMQNIINFLHYLFTP